jgi:predicted RNase H-like nuclease (RuvC/YqgF family)
MTNDSKRDSPLVVSVIALQNYLTELERVGAKINSADMTSDVDLDCIQKLMVRFSQCGQGVSDELSTLSTQLQEARERAEAVAQGVSRQAEAFNAQRKNQDEHWERFRQLGERVRELNTAIGQFRRPQGNGFTSEDRTALTSSIPGLERQLGALIGELHDLRDSARGAGMRALQKDAESLAQTLQAVQMKLRDLGG